VKIRRRNFHASQNRDRWLRAADGDNQGNAGAFGLAGDSDLRADGNLAVPYSSKVKSHMGNLSADEKHRVQTRTGYPMLGIEVRVVDEDGKDVAANGNQVGEVIARANVVMRGYGVMRLQRTMPWAMAGFTAVIWQRSIMKAISRSLIEKRI